MSPIEIDRILRTALGHLQSGQFAQAEALYRQILAQHRDHDGALHWLGVLALQVGRHDLAAEYLARACELQPNVSAYHGNLGNALMGLGQLDEAVASYRRALALKPDLAEAHNTLGNALMRQGNSNEAIACYCRALALKPDYAEAHNNLGNALKVEGTRDEAIDSYRRALTLKPDYAEAHNNLGNALKDAGKLDEAIDHYRQALAINPVYAEAHDNLGNALHDRGKVDEAVASYRRALELAPNFAEAHDNLGKALHGQGMFDEAVACIRQALALRPGSAEMHNNLGNALRDLRDFDEAIASYRRALELKPDYAEAHGNLGEALYNQGKLEEAEACNRRALELMPNYPEAHNNLGVVLMRQGKVDEAVACYRRSLDLKPDDAEAHNNLGVALQDQRLLDEAESHLDESIRLRPDSNPVRVNRSYLLLLRGEFAPGWKEYERRLKPENRAARILAFPQPKWDGSPLDGRTVLLHREQGLGDTLQFVRYARMVAQSGGNVIVECQPSLKRLLQHSLGSIPVVDDLQSPPPFDVHFPLMSLPFAYGTTLATIPRQVPYVHADPESIAQWRARFADGGGHLKVGLVWAGSKAQSHDHYRSMALRTLAPLGQAPGVRFYSLQKGEPAQQTLRSPAGLQLIDWTDDLRDFADTAAFVANLDLVISVCTSVAHLAGAMGKPVWTLLSFAGCWRWLLDRDDSPWYPTMRLFRQPSLGDWPSVVERVADSLRQLAPSDRNAGQSDCQLPYPVRR